MMVLLLPGRSCSCWILGPPCWLSNVVMMYTCSCFNTCDGWRDVCREKNKVGTFAV